MSIKRIVKWADRTGERLCPNAPPWVSWLAHWGLSMLGSESIFWLGRIGSQGCGLTMGMVTAWWCFFAYRAREDRQERDGLHFETGDLVGPLANAILWTVAWVLWLYYSLGWRW